MKSKRQEKDMRLEVVRLLADEERRGAMIETLAKLAVELFANQQNEVKTKGHREDGDVEQPKKPKNRGR